MKLIILLCLLALWSSAALASDNRWEGFTGLGYDVKSMIKRYENADKGSQEYGEAIVTFTHIGYTIIITQEVIQKYNNGVGVDFFCLKNAKRNPVAEIDLFISWVKIEEAKGKPYMNDAITIAYPLYLADMYPISECD